MPGKKDVPRPSRWESARSESTAIRVERQIKDAVLDGRLRPGDFIGSENDLAAEFGVSRLPIREALSRLHTLGVIEVRTGAGGGAKIASSNLDRFAEALALQLKLGDITAAEVLLAQELIECEAAALAAQNATESDCAKMEEAIDLAEEKVASKAEFVPASMRVHECMTKASRNMFLTAMMHAIIVVLYREVYDYATPTIARSVIMHQRSLLSAIRDKNSAGARKLVGDHIRRVSASVLKGYEKKQKQIALTSKSRGVTARRK